MKTLAFVSLCILLVPLVANAQMPAQTATNATAGTAPQNVSEFGGLKVGDAVAEGWNVRDITSSGREVSVTVNGAAQQPLTFVFSLDPGPKGPFDRDDVRVYYRTAAAAAADPMTGTVGKAIVDRVAAFAASRGGLKPYLTAFTTSAMKNHPEENVTAANARRFLDRLAGKWNLTAFEYPDATPVPKTIGTGTARRERFMNDLILREDSEGKSVKEMMLVGCKPDVGRCWLLIVNNTSSGFHGGWGVFSESEQALKVFDEATKQPAVILRSIDESRNVLEFYGSGVPARIVRTIRYDRAK